MLKTEMAREAQAMLEKFRTVNAFSPPDKGTVKPGFPSGDFTPTYRATILLDGVDISNLCWAFDVSGDKAYCYREGEDGRPYIENGEIASVVLEGKIEVSEWLPDFTEGSP